MNLLPFQEIEKTLELPRLAACVVLAPLGLVVPASKRALALGILGLAAALAFAPDSFPAFAATGTLVFGLAHLVARVGDPTKRWRLTLILIVTVCAAFVFGRGYGLEDARVTVAGARVAVFALDMWMLLRVVSILWEVGSGKVAPPRVVAYLAWIALPFTLVGPLVRPAQFMASLETPAPRRVLDTAWWRKVAIACAQLLGAYACLAFDPTQGHTATAFVKLLKGFTSAPWSFYLRVAGLYSLMEALAGFWGIDVPPSFNAPFGRRNLADFWANWNMTATNIIRDYLFFARWGFAKPNFYLNSIIVFVLVGAWHGSNAYWLIFGAYHGIGYCGYLWFKRHKLRFGAGRAGALAAAALTYVFVCSAWMLPSQIIRIAEHFSGR